MATTHAEHPTTTPDTTQDKAGHQAHTQASDRPEGLPGCMPRPINVTLLGAGSFFTSTLCSDIAAIPGNQGGELRLVDTDPDRLEAMRQVVEKMLVARGLASMWSVKASVDRLTVLPGTDFAICCVEVAGVECVGLENDIPLKYGVDQCIGDTIGPGGLFKAMKTVPVFLNILRDMKELCPRARMLNYTNPMSMMILAAGRAVPEIPVVGLCHSVQGTSHYLADMAGVPYREMRWECAGINHLAWFTRLEHRDADLYQTALFEKFEADLAEAEREYLAGKARHDAADLTPNKPGWDEKGYEQDDLVRKDMCLHFGAFITESSGHLSEYVPYYRKSEAGRKWLRAGYSGGTRFYGTNWPTWRTRTDAQRTQLISGERPFDLARSWEYGSWIVEAIEKDAPLRIHGNVMNYGTQSGRTAVGEAAKLIANLPGDGCVEVACLVDGNGVQPLRYGALPPHMAHLCASNMAMFDLGVHAVLERSREAAIHALYLDPLCQAVLTPREIKAMTLEMFEAEKNHLSEYA